MLHLPVSGLGKRLLPFLFLFSCLQLMAQEISIGSGNILHQGLPIEPAAHFSYSQQLYHSSQIGISGTITRLSFQYNSSSSIFYEGNKHWRIYLGHSDLDSIQDWLPLSELSLVFDGILSYNYFSAGLPGSGWLTIPLQESFYYDSQSNLIVAVDENTDGQGSTSDDFFCSSMNSIRAISFQSPTINPDPADPPQTFLLKTYLSNIRLNFGNTGGPGAPRNLWGYFASGAVQLSWQAPLEGIPVSYIVKRDSEPIGELGDTSYQDADVLPGNSYFYAVQARYQDSGVSEDSNVIQICIPEESSDTIIFQSFESLPAFSTNIPGYLNLDLDLSPTWCWNDIDYPGEGSAQAFSVFCPSQTNPPFTQVSAHNGSQMLLAMSGTEAPNNDWLILPGMDPGNGATFSFWARSLTAAYGLERLRVMISTTDASPQSFQALSAEPWLAIPAQWTLYEYDLSAYAGMDIYLALNCVSMDAFALFIDDLEVQGVGGALPSCDIVADLPLPYPNPARGSFSIKDQAHFSVDIFNIKGQRIARKKNCKSLDSSEFELAAGIYLIRIKQGLKQRSFRQVILP